MKICPPYFSKIKLNCEKPITFLMIPNKEEKVKKVSALLKRITPKK